MKMVIINENTGKISSFSLDGKKKLIMKALDDGSENPMRDYESASQIISNVTGLIVRTELHPESRTKDHSDEATKELIVKVKAGTSVYPVIRELLVIVCAKGCAFSELPKYMRLLMDKKYPLVVASNTLMSVEVI